MAMIAGTWRLRLGEFYRLQARHGGDWKRAAYESGVSERVAMVIAANTTLQQRQRLVPVAKLHEGRGAVVLAADPGPEPRKAAQATQKLPSIAELQAAATADYERAKSLSTAEMRVVASWLDRHPRAPMRQAADACGFTMEQIDGWARKNGWFAEYMDHEGWGRAAQQGRAGDGVRNRSRRVRIGEAA